MSADAHTAQAATTISTTVGCYVLTVSDTRTADTDTSGRAIRQLLEAGGHRVTGQAIVPDEPARVAAAVQQGLGDPDTTVVIATGGTGIAPRDLTIEAVVPLFDKRLDGFGEIFRALSFQEIGGAAMLSRAAAGTVGAKAVFLLPGSEKAVRLAMTRLIVPQLGHVAHLLWK